MRVRDREQNNFVHNYVRSSMGQFTSAFLLKSVQGSKTMDCSLNKFCIRVQVPPYFQLKGYTAELKFYVLWHL